MGARGLAVVVVSALNSNEADFKVVFAASPGDEASVKEDKDECMIPLTLPRISLFPPPLVQVWCVLYLSLLLRSVVSFILRGIEATGLRSSKQLRGLKEMEVALESSISLACYAREIPLR